MEPLLEIFLWGAAILCGVVLTFVAMAIVLDHTRPGGSHACPRVAWSSSEWLGLLLLALAGSLALRILYPPTSRGFLGPTRAGMEPWQAWVVVGGLGLMGLVSWMLGRRQRRARSDGAAKADDTSPE